MGYIGIVRSLKDPGGFDPFAKPVNDAQRVEALRRFQVFDTPSEEIFSAYTKLAALLLNAPIALMSFVEEDQVYYKEAYGVDRTGELVDRKNSPCTLAIQHDEAIQFRYKLTDPCVLADRDLLAESGYKFYAGAPITTSDQMKIGILAVADKKPRLYSSTELHGLESLAVEVMDVIEHRLSVLNTPRYPELTARVAKIHERIRSLSQLNTH